MIAIITTSRMPDNGQKHIPSAITGGFFMVTTYPPFYFFCY